MKKMHISFFVLLASAQMTIGHSMPFASMVASTSLPQTAKTSFDDSAKQELMNETGRVTVRFVVEKDGTISNIDIARSPDPILSNEAIRIVSSMPKWSPGIKDNKLVRTLYLLPVTFKLP